MPSLISIIIPHYARPALLAEAVASVRASTEQRFEILIVDDGSDASDWEALQELADERTRILRRDDGIKGPSRCRNLGLAAANGDFVIFLDSDDLMSPWCLEQRLAAVSRMQGSDFLVFPVLLFEHLPGDMDLLWNSMEDGRPALERFASSDPPWHTSSPIWRTSSIRQLGGFNEAVFYGDDADLHLRALATGLKMTLQADFSPDIFIRRSDTPRITNSLSPFLIESRRTRLRELTRFLKSRPDCARLMPIWEGQYFVEAEFLLFNHEPPGDAVRLVVKDWQADCQTSRFNQWVVTLYFAVALATRKSAYLILRVARRVAMALLPACYFPSGGSFHNAKAKEAVMVKLGNSIGTAHIDSERI